MNDILPVRDFIKRKSGHVHMVGICGIGMAGLAFLLKSRGFKVSGCDVGDSAIADWLTDQGIEVLAGHDSAHLTDDVEWVVRTAAVPSDHEEIQCFTKAGIPVFSRGSVLPELLEGNSSVAVGGTHGKTTTSSFIAQILKAADSEVSWCIGGECESLTGVAGITGKCSDGQIVVEADESDGTIALYSPDIAVVTNIEYDHMEHFDNEESFVKCFDIFMGNAKSRVIYNVDDECTASLIGDKPAISFGFSDAADLRAKNIVEKAESVSFTLESNGKELGVVDMPVIGEHNIMNALAASAVAFELGLTFDQIRSGLSNICLPGRRFEKVVDSDGITIISDYAHHPSEISALIKTARKLCKDRLLVVFQPHRYTRTLALGSDFPPAFNGVDELLLLPVYPASEAPLKGGMAADLYALFRASGCDLILGSSLEKAWDYYKEKLRKGDLLLVVGAGDVVQIAQWATRDQLPAVSARKSFEEFVKAESIVSKVSYNEDLAKKTTMKVGGSADLWLEAESISELSAIMKWANDAKLPFRMLGAGSNTLISDLGLRGITSRMVGDELCGICEREGEIVVGCGVSIAKLLNWLEKQGMSGLEFMEGIPGSVGGALRMNAGAYGDEIGKHISWIRCLNMDGSECIVSATSLDLGYRSCGALEGKVAVEVAFTVESDEAENIKSRRGELAERRAWMKGLRSAGSIFKNPVVKGEVDSAGSMLEKVGLKGIAVGRAFISREHANIFVTEDGASASDVIALIGRAQVEVSHEYGVDLELEIKILE